MRPIPRASWDSLLHPRATEEALRSLVEGPDYREPRVPCEDCNGLGGFWERGELGVGIFVECRECEGTGSLS